MEQNKFTKAEIKKIVKEVFNDSKVLETDRQFILYTRDPKAIEQFNKALKKEINKQYNETEDNS
jgi:hypothetical protein